MKSKDPQIVEKLEGVAPQIPHEAQALSDETKALGEETLEKVNGGGMRHLHPKNPPYDKPGLPRP